MGKITGSGVPTKETAGYIGDIYEDTSTGKEYICVFSCVIGDSIDCEWEEAPTNSKTEESDVKISPEKIENKNIPNKRNDYTMYGKDRKYKKERS